jgi:DNA-binding protein
MVYEITTKVRLIKTKKDGVAIMKAGQVENVIKGNFVPNIDKFLTNLCSHYGLEVEVKSDFKWVK